MENILVIEKLYKRYTQITAVNHISFAVKKGSCFGLLGPNGAGKTTTIEIIEGICKPTSGKIFYKGKLNNPLFIDEAGIQFQQTGLPDYLKVYEVLKLFQSFYKASLSIEEIVELCELGEVVDRYATKLSGGQKQRLLLALALINNPQIIFLDEPTTGLDPNSRRKFWALINKIKAHGKTIILTTHYMDEAETLCDELLIMQSGNIIEQGVPLDLLNKYFSHTKITLNENLEKIQHLFLSEELSQHQGKAVITTNKLNETMSTLLQENIPLTHIQVKTPNLEDLFIKLTENS